MATGSVQVYYGAGRGKSPAALGRAIRAAAEGKTVFIIQFLKGKSDEEMEFLKRLEPEIKFFRFEKSEEYFSELSEEEQLEEVKNIKNGINFAKKVLTTGECDLVILDEVLGLVDHGLIAAEELKTLIGARLDDTDLIMTGWVLSDELRPYIDEIYHLIPEKIPEKQGKDIDN
ncbi:cob(I)yrinic acid a,c-diamide adenosyltransferase [Roseburia sp. BX1005]|uniref:Cob(I)yrinic acid a,c-diamide adenosyltransferase n=1 Tax=Roseburia zhanii TaxID=2763064 RepID=A0A923LQK9_9FIRM|nr:cob(I)yrinic acid a,c-diamide adenosyltransferase [Roseburia zhanii]MBC5714106.1 cob(I)yrinic acid a,c-diamide adenosyltransferase [Roseburia zhanii]